MATERQSPDAILASTGLTGTVADIDEDPDSPDGSWLTASAGSNTELHVSFPSPSGTLTGTQEFRVLVRKTAESTAPTGRIELWENGSPISAGSDVAVSSDTVLSLNWDASAVTNSDNVELKVIGTVGGGKPADRAALEVGAAEWNVSYAGVVNETVSPGSASLSISSDAVSVQIAPVRLVPVVPIELAGIAPSIVVTANHVRGPPAYQLSIAANAPSIGGSGENIIVRPGMIPSERDQYVTELLG